MPAPAPNLTVVKDTGPLIRSLKDASLDALHLSTVAQDDGDFRKREKCREAIRGIEKIIQFVEEME